MQKCSEERRKLAVEWAEFRTQQQLSKERMERDIDRALQMDSQREGTIISLAKVRPQSRFPRHPALPGRQLGSPTGSRGEVHSWVQVFRMEASHWVWW